MEEEPDEHGGPGGLRPHQNAGHGLVRPRHDRAAQGLQGVLRDEDTGQAESGEAETGGAHAEREADLAGHQLPVPGEPQVPLQGQLEPVHGARVRARRRDVLAPAQGGPFQRAALALLRGTNSAGVRVPPLPGSDLQGPEAGEPVDRLAGLLEGDRLRFRETRQGPNMDPVRYARVPGARNHTEQGIQ